MKRGVAFTRKALEVFKGYQGNPVPSKKGGKRKAFPWTQGEARENPGITL